MNDSVNEAQTSSREVSGSKDIQVRRFWIRPSEYVSGYRVSIAGFQGGEVVSAEDYDSLRSQNEALREALNDIDRAIDALLIPQGEPFEDDAAQNFSNGIRHAAKFLRERVEQSRAVLESKQ